MAATVLDLMWSCFKGCDQILWQIQTNHCCKGSVMLWPAYTYITRSSPELGWILQLKTSDWDSERGVGPQKFEFQLPEVGWKEFWNNRCQSHRHKEKIDLLYLSFTTIKTSFVIKAARMLKNEMSCLQGNGKHSIFKFWYFKVFLIKPESKGRVKSHEAKINLESKKWQ